MDGYGEGDASIRGAVDRLAGAGFQTTLDMKEETWKQPKGGVGNQAAGAAFYIGWYALLDFQDIFGDHGLAQGAIAWHIASQEAQDIWDPAGKGWCINLMRRGAAVTIGPCASLTSLPSPMATFSSKACCKVLPWPIAIGYPCRMFPGRWCSLATLFTGRLA